MIRAPLEQARYQAVGVVIATAMLLMAGGLPVLASGASAPADEQVAQGAALAERLCARCHAIKGPGPSPVAQAPVFSKIGRQLDIDSLAEALAEGILTGHGPVEMPEFVFSPPEIDSLLAYLHSVQE